MYIIIIIIIKSTKYVQDILPLFVGCNMQFKSIENILILTEKLALSKTNTLVLHVTAHK